MLRRVSRSFSYFYFDDFRASRHNAVVKSTEICSIFFYQQRKQDMIYQTRYRHKVWTDLNYLKPLISCGLEKKVVCIFRTQKNMSNTLQVSFCLASDISIDKKWFFYSARLLFHYWCSGDWARLALQPISKIITN